MKKIITTVLIAFIAYAAHACYADYTYTNGCVGDTVFFGALDGYAAYTWDYGDTASGAANISHNVNGYHVYTAPGDSCTAADRGSVRSSDAATGIGFRLVRTREF